MDSDNDAIPESQSLLDGYKERADTVEKNPSQAKQNDELTQHDVRPSQTPLNILTESQEQAQSQEKSQEVISKGSSVSPKVNKRQTRVNKGSRGAKPKETKSVKRRRSANNKDSSESDSDTELKTKRKKHLKNENKVKETKDSDKTKETTEEKCVVEAINKLADQMRLGMGELSQRMSDFEATITETIKKQVLNIMAPEIEKIKDDFNSKIRQMRQEFQSSAQRQSTSATNETVEINRTLNIVVRNLPETRNENTTDKVNTLIKEGLKIQNVSVTKAVRKESKSTENGVIIASCKDREDKETVMKAKASLKD